MLTDRVMKRSRLYRPVKTKQNKTKKKKKKEKELNPGLDAR